MAHSATLTLAALLATSFHVEAQWEVIRPIGSYYSVAVHDGALYTGRHEDSIQVSTDHGDTWTPIDDGITDDSYWCLNSVGDALYCGTQFGNAFRLDAGSITWVDIGQSGARGFAMHHDTLYACTWYSPGVHWSVNGGSTWMPTGSLAGTGGLWPLISHDDHLFVGRQGGGVLRLANAQATWTVVNTGLPPNPAAYAFTTIGGDLLVGGTGSVHRSSNAGDTWTASNQGLTHLVWALHTHDTLVFAGLDGGGVYLSVDSGHTWTPMNDGLNAGAVVALASDDQYLYAGTLGAGLWRYSLDGTSQGIESAAHAGPQVDLLPNPVAPTTMLRLTLPVAAKVRVDVLDAAGRLLRRTDLGTLTTGQHQLPFNSAGLVAGTYACVITMGEGAVTRKFVVPH